jgi:hypothetical protein
MLERLFGSITRLKLLKAFLFQPTKRFTADELLRTYKFKADSLRRELDNLMELGLIAEGVEQPENASAEAVAEVEQAAPVATAKSKKEPSDAKALAGKKEKEIKYYQLNRAFVLVDEIKTLLARGQVLYERNFIDKLLTTGNIKYLMLSGFFVNRTDAPVDLLIVGRINKVKLVKIIKEFEIELGREVNFTHFEPQEFLYRKSLADVFIYELLEGPNMVVIDEILNF